MSDPLTFHGNRELSHTLGAGRKGDQDGMTKIAIIGAGFSGLTLARLLAPMAQTTVFEAADQPGGRLASRRIGPYVFDLGAQFFNVWESGLRAFLRPFLACGAAAHWRARFVEFAGPERVWGRVWDETQPHIVGAPCMEALTQAMAADVRVIYGARVARIAAGWTLELENGASHGPFDWVVSTAPAAASANLLQGLSPAFAPLADIEMKPCCVGLFGFPEPPELDWDIAVVRRDTISLMAVQTAKPGRSGPFALSVLATNAWSAANSDRPQTDILTDIADTVQRISGVDMSRAGVRALHVWKAANARRRSPPHFFLDGQAHLAACGDWARQGIVESAFLSAQALAEAMAAR
jgi:hypothetical protein